MVGEDEEGHGFDHGNGSGENAGVVTAASFEGGVLVRVGGDRELFVHDGGDRFEGDAEGDGFAIGDPALDAAGAVAGGADAAFLHAEGVVVFASGEKCSGEAAADFEALGGGQAEHGLGEVGVEFVEDRFSESWRAVADGAGDDSADAVAFGAHGFDEICHRFHGVWVGGPHDIAFDHGGGDGGGVDDGLEVLDAFDPCDNFEAGGEVGDDLAGDGGGGDAADGFAGAGAAAALPVADAVFGIVGVVGVAGTVFGSHFRVGFRAGVLVADHDGDGRSEGEAIEDAREDFAAVEFLARGDDFALAGAAAVEVLLDIFRGEGQAGRAAVDDNADAAAVAFTPCGNAEQLTPLA